MSLLLPPLVHDPLPRPPPPLLLLVDIIDTHAKRIYIRACICVCVCYSALFIGVAIFPTRLSRCPAPSTSPPPYSPLPSKLMLVVANLLLLFALNFMLMFMFFSNKSREPIEIETLLAVRISPELLRPYTIFISISVTRSRFRIRFAAVHSNGRFRPTVAAAAARAMITNCRQRCWQRTVKRILTMLTCDRDPMLTVEASAKLQLPSGNSRK